MLAHFSVAKAKATDFFLRLPTLTANNFEALHPSDPLSTIFKDLNLLKKYIKNQEKFRSDFALLFVFVCLFLWTPSFEGIRYPYWDFAYGRGWRRCSAPYQAKELQITTLANPGRQTNFLTPRPVQS